MNDVVKNGLVGQASGRATREAGIGEDKCELAKVFRQGCEKALAIFRNGDVDAVAACVWPEFSNGLVQRFLIATGNGDLCAFRNEEPGGGQADGAIPACNKGFPACELHNASLLPCI